MFNSDNGKEFIATLVVDLLKASNPNCFIVTGRPRTPRDQGSVESANKIVQQVLKCISSENRLRSIPVNWTKLLGQVMAVCNSHSGMRKNSVSSYEAVFGQKYHPQLKCNISDMRECKSIFQRLKLSPNERLETYVREHDIVDIDLEVTEIDDDNSDEDYDSEHEGDDLDDNAFPEVTFNPDDFQIGNIYHADVMDRKSAVSASATSFEAAKAKSSMAAAAMVSKVSVPPTDRASVGDVNRGGGDNTGRGSGDVGGEVTGGGSGDGILAVGSSRGRVAVTTMAVEGALPEAMVVNSHPNAPALNQTPTCQLTFDSPPPVNNDIGEQQTFRAREHSIFTVQQAWDHGNIARLFKPLGSRGEFKFLWPSLICGECTFVDGAKPFIQIGDEQYLSSITNTTNWYDGVFISSFAQLAAHYAHITADERPSLPSGVHLPLLIHITYPMEFLQAGQYKPLRQGITRVVAVLHDKDHYGVLEIDVTQKTVLIYDGLYRDLDRWLDYVFSAFKRCMLCDLQTPHLYVADDPKLMTLGRSRVPKMSIEGYQLTLGRDDDGWRFERGHFVKQTDPYNCGPIACTKILEMFCLTTVEEVNLSYRINAIRTLVTEHWRKFIQRSEQDLIVRVRERLPLRTPVAEEGDIVLPLRNSSSTTRVGDPVIAAAAGASAQAEIDPHKLCFCYCDSSDMELVRMVCCQQTIHRRCFVAYLCINSQCVFCRAVVDMDRVVELPTIDRSELLLPSTKSPMQQTPITKKRDLQEMMLDKTPLRLADTLRAESQDKKRENQREQAKRMIKMQGKDVADKGATPGAVVTVKCDYRAVSFAIGIVGVVYQVSTFGGARIATIAGLLSSGSRKGPWWIPADQYTIRYGANDEANIIPQLSTIREAILAGTYNTNNSAPKCTIQQAHQVIVQAVSPCRKSKCGCKGGECKVGRCGCIKKGFKCSSACLCNGNCAANPNNGK